MKTSTKKPAKPDWSSFTKAELIRTIKQLHARQTTHLNRIAQLEKVAADAQALVEGLERQNTLDGQSAMTAAFAEVATTCGTRRHGYVRRTAGTRQIPVGGVAREPGNRSPAR